jgi:hypothetical protein
MMLALVMILLAVVLLNFRQSGETAVVHAAMPYFSAGISAETWAERR